MDAPIALTCTYVVWRETPFFSERERAALAWAEAVTQVSSRHVPDEVYELAREHFSEKELVDLTLAIVAINGWNRPAISFRKVAGTYQPKVQAEDAATSFHSNGTPGTAAIKAAGANTSKGERT